jgi:hypothetical protein
VNEVASLQTMIVGDLEVPLLPLTQDIQPTQSDMLKVATAEGTNPLFPLEGVTRSIDSVLAKGQRGDRGGRGSRGGRGGRGGQNNRGGRCGIGRGKENITPPGLGMHSEVVVVGDFGFLAGTGELGVLFVSEQIPRGRQGRGLRSSGRGSNTVGNIHQHGILPIDDAGMSRGREFLVGGRGRARRGGRGARCGRGSQGIPTTIGRSQNPIGWVAPPIVPSNTTPPPTKEKTSNCTTSLPCMW